MHTITEEKLLNDQLMSFNPDNSSIQPFEENEKMKYEKTFNMQIGIKRARDWTIKLQNKDGSFPFAQHPTISTVGIWASAEALVAIASSIRKNRDSLEGIQRCLQWFEKFKNRTAVGAMEDERSIIESSCWAILSLEETKKIKELSEREKKWIENWLKTLVNWVVTNKNKDGGWGSWKGDISRVTTTSLAGIVLKPFNKNIISLQTDHFILSSQNDDGGWGFRVNEDSNILSTAYSLIFLNGRRQCKEGKKLLEVDEAIQLGNEYLLSEQHADGSFGDETFLLENIGRKNGITRWSHFATPVVLYALALDKAFAPDKTTLPLYKGLMNLLTDQTPEGGWVDLKEPYLTYHTYVTLYYLSKIEKIINMNSFSNTANLYRQLKGTEKIIQSAAYKNQLRKIIFEDGFGLGEFTLSSGERSTFYFDLKKPLLDPRSLDIIGKLFWELIKHEDVDSVGGPETGAISISTAIVKESHATTRPLKAFYVRKKAKKHGTKHKLEGHIKRGDKVIVVDDVITTGNSVMEGIVELEDMECKVKACIPIIYRGTNKKFREELAKRGIKFKPIFTPLDFGVKQWKEI